MRDFDEIFGYFRRNSEKENAETKFEKCCRIAKDYCDPFCLYGATCFGFAILGYDVISYTAADMANHVYETAGELLQNFPYSIANDNVGEKVVSIREHLSDSLASAIDASAKKFGISWGIGYYISRKLRGPLTEWWKKRNGGKHE